MAIITKIRERAGLAVGIVALSLGLFVVGGDLLTGNSSIFGDKQIVGEINGEDISLKEYQEEVQKLEYDFAVQQNKNPSEQDMMGIREQAWNQLIFEKVFRKQAEEAGVLVSDEEGIDMVQGNNIHSAVKSTFVDPKTQQFDKTLVVNFLRNIDQARPEQKAAWYNFEGKLPNDRLRTKYEALLTKTNYTTTAEAKREYESQTAKVNLDYMFIPFSTIPDSTIKVTDEELQTYLKGHQYKYKSQDTRGIDYVQFMILPSKDDSVYFQQELAEIKDQFKTAENDTAFAKSRSDVQEAYKVFSPNELPKELVSLGDSVRKGDVYGPFLSGSTFTIYKMVDKLNEGSFSAKASHILFKTNGTDDTAKVNAKKRAQDVLARIRKGESFEEMARQFGTDGTKDQGGDLGWFSEGKMVKPFENAVFAFSGKGLLPDVVETDFGYHIVKVTEPKTNLKYKVASIARNIAPGDKTKDDIYRKANEFRAKLTSAEEFENAVKANTTLTKMTAASLMKNSTNVNDIQEAKGLVQWAFQDETKIGDLKLYEFNDRYVVALKTKQTEEGPAKLDDVKDLVKIEVIKAKKADQIFNKLLKNNKAKDFKSMTKDLKAIAAAYGPEAVVNSQSEITFAASTMGDFGYDPVVIGRVYGMKPNESSKPFQAENGVGMVKMTTFNAAPETKDYSSYKTQIDQKYQGRGQYYITEAIKEIAKVKDNRIKYQ